MSAMLLVVSDPINARILENTLSAETSYPAVRNESKSFKDTHTKSSFLWHEQKTKTIRKKNKENLLIFKFDVDKTCYLITILRAVLPTLIM